MLRSLVLLTMAMVISHSSAAQFEHNAVPDGRQEESHKVKYHNAVAFFFGNTIIKPSGFNLPTVGIEYIREINHFLGVGIMAEVEHGSHIIQVNEHDGTTTEVDRDQAILVIPAVFARVYKGLIVSAGYGVEFEAKENLALFKLSLEYKLYMSNERFIVLPTVSWDHTHRFNGFVYGVNFGYVF